MQSHLKVEREESERRENDWREMVKNDPKIEAYPDKFIGMMINTEPMWDGHVGRICLAKHCIGLTLD